MVKHTPLGVNSVFKISLKPLNLLYKLLHVFLINKINFIFVRDIFNILLPKPKVLLYTYEFLIFLELVVYFLI